MSISWCVVLYLGNQWNNFLRQHIFCYVVKPNNILTVEFHWDKIQRNFTFGFGSPCQYYSLSDNFLWHKSLLSRDSQIYYMNIIRDLRIVFRWKKSCFTAYHVFHMCVFHICRISVLIGCRILSHVEKIVWTFWLAGIFLPKDVTPVRWLCEHDVWFF